MAATYLPSNFVTPSAKFGVNPNWEVSEAGKPEESTFVESIHDRLLVCQGEPINAPQYSNFMPAGSVSSLLVADAPNNEVVATFTFRGVQIQQCTGVQLLQVLMHLPPQTVEQRGRNLSTTLCGDLIDDSFDAPRRFVWSTCDMTIPFYLNGVQKIFSLESFIPYGRTIAYYSPNDMITYFCTALSNFMVNTMGDASFVCYPYADNVGARIFFRSPTFGLNSLRLFLFPTSGTQQNAMQLLLNHFMFTTPRVDTTQAVGTGESFGVMVKRTSGLQNNSPFLTIHSNELTQYRKSDSVAPVEGSSLIGVCTPSAKFDDGTSDSEGTYLYRVEKGTLVTPKISFDKNKALTTFDVALRVAAANVHFEHVKVSQAELSACKLCLIFRMW